MKRISYLMAFCLIYSFWVTPKTFSQSNDARVKQIVSTIEAKLADIKGYDAEVESQNLDPNGGFNKFNEEHTVWLPDRMRVKRKVLVAHNHDQVGQEITTVIDGTWLMTRAESVHTSCPRGPAYSMANLKVVEAVGGPSVLEYISMMGNLADPFRLYRLDTLKLKRETESEWIFLAEYKKAFSGWEGSILTIDKKTAFLKKVEAVVPEIDRSEMGDSVVLLVVKKVIQKDTFTNDLLKLELPSLDPRKPLHIDDTDRLVIYFKRQQERAKFQNTP